MVESQADEPEVLLDIKDTVAFVTLNRPRALNSLSSVMVRRLLELNQQFTQQHHQQRQQQQAAGPRIACVVVKGAVGKAFCAGGDVKEVVLRARSGDTASGSGFFRTEYLNNAAIAELPVPYVALIDGIVMGGGVGVSYHGHFRVATERTVLAMPEAGIGLFPDVGASCFLHRLPGYLGRYMGLTGQRLTGADVKHAGFATHLVPSARLSDLERALVQLGARAADLAELDKLLRSFEPSAPPTARPGAAACSDLLDWKLPLINAHFGQGSVEAVVASLEAAVAEAEREEQREKAGTAGTAAGAVMGAAGGSELRTQARAFLRDTLAAMKRGSPLSHAVTWEMLRRSAASHLTLRQCLEMEFALVGHCLAGDADFIEGVRALLIDKDNQPRWRYASVREVPAAVVNRMFERDPREPPLFPDLALPSRM